MKTQTVNNELLKGEELNAFAAKLKNAGFEVFTVQYGENKPTYFYFTAGDNIGYCQIDRLGGAFTFSSVHKPNKACGTGFRIGGETYEPTIEQAKEAFVTAPYWASIQDRKHVVKYSSVDEFKSKSHGTIINL